MTDPTFRHSIIAAGVTGIVATIGVVVGWSVFEFDPALFLYAEALILSLTLTVYRFAIWLHRPPTTAMFRSARSMLKSSDDKASLAMHLGRRILTYFAMNQFVWKRGPKRWGAHFPIMIGCVAAMAIVVPLIFGWVWFETPADDFSSYKVMAFGVPLRTLPVDGFEAFLAFHGLVWASFPVLIGCGFALQRRLRDRGDAAVQTFVGDLLPLFLLLAITLSGLAMTVSYSFLGGALHQPIAIAHMIIVCLTLLWLPYSKLFHIPQRSLKLAHMLFAHEAAAGPKASCCRCGDAFADQAQIDDLIQIQQQLGYSYESADANGHYQNVCPQCRRASVVIAQGTRWMKPSTAVVATPVLVDSCPNG